MSEIPTRRIAITMLGAVAIALIFAGAYNNNLMQVIESNIFLVDITAIAGVLAWDRIENMATKRKNGNGTEGYTSTASREYHA